MEATAPEYQLLPYGVQQGVQHPLRDIKNEKMIADYENIYSSLPLFWGGQGRVTPAGLTPPVHFPLTILDYTPPSPRLGGNKGG